MRELLFYLLFRCWERAIFLYVNFLFFVVGWKRFRNSFFYGRSKLLQKPFRIQSCYINEVNAFYGEATLGFPLCDTFSSSKNELLPFYPDPWLIVIVSLLIHLWRDCVSVQMPWSGCTLLQIGPYHRARFSFADFIPFFKARNHFLSTTHRTVSIPSPTKSYFWNNWKQIVGN